MYKAYVHFMSITLATPSFADTCILGSSTKEQIFYSIIKLYKRKRKEMQFKIKISFFTLNQSHHSFYTLMTRELWPMAIFKAFNANALWSNKKALKIFHSFFQNC